VKEMSHRHINAGAFHARSGPRNHLSGFRTTIRAKTRGSDGTSSLVGFSNLLAPRHHSTDCNSSLTDDEVR
jgi:hypothetical protein